ncbi:MAG: nitroreductase family protein [Candidatus Woesearchaeota archaeon]
MDAIECIRTRRSVRKYLPAKVPADTLKEIVECANLAPSARAIYPWHFVVVSNRDNLDRIAGLATYGSFLKAASACIIVCGQKSHDFTVIDCSAATQNILLAATAKGIGSCWVNAWRKPYNEEIAGIIGLPDSLELVSIVSLGYPAENPSSKSKPVEEVLHWEKYA